MKTKLFQTLAITLILVFATSSCGIYRPVDVKDAPIDPAERVKKNMEEGRGFRLLDRTKSGGKFDFASSNELWRAALDTIDFMPLASANYSGGIIITDWYSDDSSGKEYLKITIRFLTNEIRSDALDVKVFKKDCGVNQNCAMYQEDGDIILEIKKSILKKAALYKKNKLKSKGKDKGTTGFSNN